MSNLSIKLENASSSRPNFSNKQIPSFLIKASTIYAPLPLVMKNKFKPSHTKATP